MSLPDRRVGYTELISRYGLFCVEDRTSSFIAKRRSVVDRTEHADGSVVVRYPGKYDFDDTLSGHLEFCLKYEGVNLSVIAALFEQRGADELQAWLDSKPGSRYARVYGHLTSGSPERRSATSCLPALMQFQSSTKNAISLRPPSATSALRFFTICLVPRRSALLYAALRLCAPGSRKTWGHESRTCSPVSNQNFWSEPSIIYREPLLIAPVTGAFSKPRISA